MQDDQDKEVLATVNDFVSKEFTELSEDLWRLEMKGDSMSQFVLKCLKEGWPSNRSKVVADYASFCQVANEIEENSGLIFKGGNIPPTSLQGKVI